MSTTIHRGKSPLRCCRSCWHSHGWCVALGGWHGRATRHERGHGMNLEAISITIVSGLPRSGTSMMMQMLEAGGMSVLNDAVRQADADNPKGYYEFERVKRLGKGDTAWLPEAHGKVVKVVSPLLQHLPMQDTA